MKKFCFIFFLTTSLSMPNSALAQLASYCTGPVIVMEAEGEVESIPDTAEVTLTVKSENEDASLALEELANNISNVLDVLKNLNVAENDIRTDTVNIRPNYNGIPYNIDGKAEITGYTGSSFVYFKTTDVSNLAELVNNVMRESENLFSNITYSSSNEDQILFEAREIAHNKAHAKAKQYAELSGNSLGDICTITEGDIEDVMDYGNYVAARSPGLISLNQAHVDIPNIPIKPGIIKTTAKVSIVYQLEN